MKTNNKDIAQLKEVWSTRNYITDTDQSEFQFNIIGQIAENFALGSFYYFVFNFATMTMEYVSDSCKHLTGIAVDKLDMNVMLNNLYHPDDHINMAQKEHVALDFLFNKIEKEQIPEYKVVYLSKYLVDGKQKDILHQSRALSITEEGKIHRVICVHTDVTHLNMVDDLTISFISNTLPSYLKLDSKNPIFELSETKPIYSERELTIIKCIAEGKSNDSIAPLLDISVHTVMTHRKNILAKSGARNTAHLVAQSIRAGLV